MTDEALQLLNRITAFSPYLTHILRQQPSLADEIFGREGWREIRSSAQLRQDLKEKVGRCQGFSDLLSDLASF